MSWHGSIEFLAGDWGKCSGAFILGKLVIGRQEIAPWEIANVSVANEETIRKGGFGMAALGGIALGPVGLIAGAILGRSTKKTVTFIAVMRDGRKCIGKTDSDTWEKLLAACFR